MLHSHHTLTDAAAALAESLELCQPTDPLIPRTIIVPNMDTARWLKLELAESARIAANLNLILPSKWGYTLIRKLYPTLPKLLPSDLQPLAWTLFECLNSPEIQNYPPLERYLSRQSHQSIERSAWQLASRIASVLDQYMVYRPELLLEWQRGKTGNSEEEEWQAELWRDLNHRWNSLPDSQLHLNRAELSRDLMNALKKGIPLCTEPLFFFQPGLLPAPLLEAAKLCGRQQEVHFFVKSPFDPHVGSEMEIVNPLIGSLGREAVELHQHYSHSLGTKFSSPEKPDSGNRLYVPGLNDHPPVDPAGVHPDSPAATEIPESGRPINETAWEGKPPMDPARISPKSPFAAPKGESVHPMGQKDEQGRPENGPHGGEEHHSEPILSTLKRIQHAVRHNLPFPDEREDRESGRAGLLADSSIRVHSCHSPLREVETLYETLLALFERDETLSPEDILVTTPDPAAYEPYIRAVFGSQEEGLPYIPWHLSSSGSAENEVEALLRSWLALPDSRFYLQPVMDLFSLPSVSRHVGVTPSTQSTINRWIEENHVIWGLHPAHREEEGQPPADLQTWNSALKRIWLGQWMAEEAGHFYGDTLLYAGVRTADEKEAWAAFTHWLDHLIHAREESVRDRTTSEWIDWIIFHLQKMVGEETLRQKEGVAVMRILEQLREASDTSGSKSKLSFPLMRTILLSRLDQRGAAGALFTRGVTFSSMVPVRSIPFRVIALIGLNDGTFPRRDQAPDFDLMAAHPRRGERNRKLEDRNLFLESVMSAGDLHYVSYVGQSEQDNEEIPPSPVVSEWLSLFGKNGSPIRKEPLHLFSESGIREGRVLSPLAIETAKKLSVQRRTASGLLRDLSGDPDEEWRELFSGGRMNRFFNSPVRYYFTHRMGASLSSPEEEREEFTLNALDRHQLFEQIMSERISGVEEEAIVKRLLRSGALPMGWLGEKTVNELIRNARTALSTMNEIGLEPRFSDLQITLEVGGIHLNETVPSYSDRSLLSVETSSVSGSLLIRHWIRHLLWQASSGSDDPSLLLCELKKGEPKMYRFEPSDAPLHWLEKLMELYKRGHQEPLLFFPKTLWEYVSAENSPRGKNPFEAAKWSFEGDADSDYNFPESDHFSMRLLLGPEPALEPAALSEEFLEFFREINERIKKERVK